MKCSHFLIGVGSLMLLGFLVSVYNAKYAAAEEKKTPDDGFPDLVGALKETSGCLGVETARTQSGKDVIFAWFEDKKAAMKWYYSPTHVAVMKKFFGDYKRPGKPMADVPDDCGPILAIASITLTGQPTREKLPFKQISIELYTPLTGGLSIGGTFAPAGVKAAKNAASKEATN